MHKIIIAYSCEYFKALLSHDVIETKNNQVNFTFDKKVFSELINYLYSGDVSLSEHNISGLIEMSNYIQVIISICYNTFIYIINY